MAGIATCGLLLACSGAADEDGLDAPLAEAEEPLETSPANEAEPEPEATEEPVDEPADDAPAIGEDEPLYAPLPELTPDPDNDIPDELEQLILDAYANAYDVEYTAYATGESTDRELQDSHFGTALDSVRETIDSLASRAVVERSPDTSVDRVWITQFEGGAAVVRECFTTGPRTGQYAADSLEMTYRAPEGTFAQDRLIEFVQLDDEDEPRLRVTQMSPAGTDEC
ncbi:hypothetical protein [Egicoccus sp. AB-alg2]|uniref:hypothetical protein n=1 Tax=Egicoccus sp. AB-alg2 TaxID=3242693 RepID=UPI00359D7455